MIIDLTIENYQEFTKEDKILIFDYYTPDCGPCKAMLPILDSLEKKYTDKIIIIKVNASNADFQDLVFDNGIRAVPTFLIMKGAKVIEKITGSTVSAKFEKIIDLLLSQAH
jgi:thiol-disulfide isomerase/thioredoxin